MALFGFGKKQADVKPVTPAVTSRYKVLGTGCTKCDALTRNVTQALDELGLTDGVEHVSELSQIASYGIMSVPALVIDDKVVSVGKVLTVADIKRLVKVD